MIDLHDHFIQQFQTQGSKKGIKITKQHQPTKRNCYDQSQIATITGLGELSVSKRKGAI